MTDIRVDDLILFFRIFDEEKNEQAIVNRLVSHKVYAAEERKLTNVDERWRDVILSEPSVSGSHGQHYYVANLSRLQLPDAAPPDHSPLPQDFWEGAGAPGKFQPGDLVLFPPDHPDAWFHIPRKIIDEKCPKLSHSQTFDLEFMACEEGSVLANVPKVTPQGCTCILLSLVGLRSGMLKHSAPEPAKTKTITIKGRDTGQYMDKSGHAKIMSDALQRGHQKKP